MKKTKNNPQISESSHNIKKLRKHLVYITIFPLFTLALAAGIFYGSLQNNGTQAAPLKFSGSYETGNLSQWGNCQFVNYNNPCASAPNTYSIRAQSAQKRYGNYAGRFELHDGDTQAGTNERTEVQTGSVNASEGQEMWYAQSILFDSTFPSTHTWGLVSQFKSNGGTSPPMGIYVDHGTNLWGLTINNYSNSSNFTSNQVWSTALTRNVWHDVKLHIKWSASDSIGYVELWYNGTKQTFKGACAGQTKCVMSNMIPGVAGNNYYKQGYYRCACVSGTGVVYHDEFRAAASEADLGAPFSTNSPPPVPAPTSQPAPNPSPAPAPKPSSPPPITPPISSPPSTKPPVSIPGANPTTPVTIPVNLPVSQNGTVVADFTGDGVNDTAKDSNNDGTIDPTNELVLPVDETNADVASTGFNEDEQTITSNNAAVAPNVILLTSGPFKNATIPKPVAYTFLTTQTFVLSGLGAYAAIMKLAFLAGLRGKLGL